MKNVQTWGWADVLAATMETDAGLRRKVQRGQVEFEGSGDDARTSATLWDIANVRVMRHLCDLGFEPARAFGIAKLAVKKAYGEIKSGKKVFSAHNAETQTIVFLVVKRDAAPNLAGVRLVSINPANPELGKEELWRAMSDTTSVVVQIHHLVRDAWYALPNLPPAVANWLKTGTQAMQKVGLI